MEVSGFPHQVGGHFVSLLNLIFLIFELAKLSKKQKNILKATPVCGEALLIIYLNTK